MNTNISDVSLLNVAKEKERTNGKNLPFCKKYKKITFARSA
ncbi:hypothetical protein [Leptospira limi]|nr:hypothetical protein [Leptospira limi]